MPGNTIGSEAKLSRSQRPGSFVLTTIQQMTDVTSMISVALDTASSKLFQKARSWFRSVRSASSAPKSTEPRSPSIRANSMTSG